MTETNPKGTRALRAGFTLLEVLGAVAILGISYIMLATASIQGLQAIGQSQRRIEASLLADQTLVELEIETETGQLLDPRIESWESGPFEVEIEILDLSEIHEGIVDSGADAGLLEYLGIEANGAFAPYRESNLLLGYLREIHIRVRWLDGADELDVTRTAFIYDQQGWVDNEQAGGQSEQEQLQGQQELENGDLPDDLRNRLQDQTVGAER